jgi:hypothetical protein
MEHAYALVGCTDTPTTSPVCTPLIVAAHFPPFHSFTGA